MADARDGRHHFPLFLGMTVKISVLCTVRPTLLYIAVYLQCAAFNPSGDFGYWEIVVITKELQVVGCMFIDTSFHYLTLVCQWQMFCRDSTSSECLWIAIRTCVKMLFFRPESDFGQSASLKHKISLKRVQDLRGAN